MSEERLKVTDRRMFTAEGELREEYRDVQATSGETTASAAPEPRPAAPETRSMEPSAPPEARQAPPPAAGGEELQPGAPSFFDLVGLLAEPASAYLHEAQTASPQMAGQNLELARLHIDLLAVLRDKTRNNLDAEEKAMLDDVVYQLRSAFVRFRG